jgi:hypothetical protein
MYRISIGRYDNLTAGSFGTRLTGPTNTGLIFLYDPSSIRLGNSNRFVNAVIIDNYNFVVARELLPPQ